MQLLVYSFHLYWTRCHESRCQCCDYIAINMQTVQKCHLWWAIEGYANSDLYSYQLLLFFKYGLTLQFVIVYLFYLSSLHPCFGRWVVSHFHCFKHTPLMHKISLLSELPFLHPLDAAKHSYSVKCTHLPSGTHKMDDMVS